MVNPDTSRRLWSLGLFALPLVAAKLAAIMLGGGSQHASAALQPAATEAVAPAPVGAAGGKVEWTAAQNAAAQHVSALSVQAFGPSPMLYVPAPKPVVPEIVAPEPEPIVVEVVPEPEPQPVFILQALMTAPNGDKAVINGRAYVQGERIGVSAWVVREISVTHRTATLENDQTFDRLVIFVQGPR